MWSHLKDTKNPLPENGTANFNTSKKEFFSGKRKNMCISYQHHKIIYAANLKRWMFTDV